jgi:hypothetical protein
MTIKGVGGVVESGCKRIYNDQNQYFLDLKPVNYDICTFTRVVVTSTYLYFGVICDISGFQRGGFLQIISETVEKP